MYDYSIKKINTKALNGMSMRQKAVRERNPPAERFLQ